VDTPSRTGLAWGVQKGRRRPQAACPAGGHTRNSREAILGMACLQGILGLGMIGPGETFGSPWPSHAKYSCPLLTQFESGLEQQILIHLLGLNACIVVD
jgi:hypothetical protein